MFLPVNYSKILCSSVNDMKLQRKIYSTNIDSFAVDSGAPNENIVQNHLNVAVLNVF